MLHDDLVLLVDNKIAAEHKSEHHSAGDGITSPRESWVTCSCGIHVWDWQQFYNENESDPEAQFALHVAYFTAYEAAKMVLTNVANEIQRLHPGEIKASVELLRERASECGVQA